MSSACLLVNHPSLGAVPRSSPPLTVRNSSTTSGSWTSLWRPWLSCRSDDEAQGYPQSKLSCPYSRARVAGCSSSDRKFQAFQHPVRLLWPKSKSFDYLYSDGEALLRNFPCQATISFYEECDSDNEDEEDWEDEGDSEECLKQQFVLHHTAKPFLPSCYRPPLPVMTFSNN